jgi:hypothetical protein
MRRIGFSPGLFFENMRDEPRCTRDHEDPVECREIHSQVSENRANRVALTSVS